MPALSPYARGALIRTFEIPAIFSLAWAYFDADVIEELEGWLASIGFPNSFLVAGYVFTAATLWILPLAWILLIHPLARCSVCAKSVLCWYPDHYRDNSGAPWKGAFGRWRLWPEKECSNCGSWLEI